MAENEQQYLSLALRVFAAEATAEEQRTLRDWRAADSQNEDRYAEWRQSWALTADYQPVLQIDEQAAWKGIEKRINASVNSQPRRFQVLRYWPYAIAAAIALGLFFGLWQYQNDSEAGGEQQWQALQTSKGERKEFVLPDSSFVVLNGNSELRYPEPFNRQVRLKGEAYFEVRNQAGASFQLRTSQTKVTTSGAVFSLRSYPEEGREKLWVAERKVRFESLITIAQSEIFTAGQGGLWFAHSDSILHDSTASSNRLAWQTGRLVFDRASLAQVISSLEGYFEIHIEVSNPAVLDCRFTADVQDPKLEELLNAMAFSLDLKVERQGTQYVLIGKGCED